MTLVILLRGQIPTVIPDQPTRMVAIGDLHGICTYACVSSLRAGIVDDDTSGHKSFGKKIKSLRDVTGVMI
jgi:hypothetical protein